MQILCNAESGWYLRSPICNRLQLSALICGQKALAPHIDPIHIHLRPKGF
jgi:hypothetical protein